MSHNLILDELHAARAQLLAAAGGDIHRYVEEAKRRTLASGRVIAEPTGRDTRGNRAKHSELQEPAASPQQ